MTSDTIDYILNYHTKLMTRNESLAWRHYSSTYKLEDIAEVSSKDSRREMYLKHGWLSVDENILDLLKDGIEHFRKKTANRIFAENTIDFNTCPQCDQLARTPLAKQCRYCLHDWL